MTWKTRPDGALDLAVVTGFEIATTDVAVAIRFEVARTKDQLAGRSPCDAEQLVLAPKLAEALLAAIAEQTGRHGPSLTGDSKGRC